MILMQAMRGITAAVYIDIFHGGTTEHLNQFSAELYNQLSALMLEEATMLIRSVLEENG